MAERGYTSGTRVNSELWSWENLRDWGQLTQDRINTITTGLQTSHLKLDAIGALQHGHERGHIRFPFISRRYKQIYISLLHPHELAYVLIIFSHSRSHWNNLLEWLQYSPPGSMIWRWLLSTYQIYYIYNYCYDPNIVGMRYRWSSLNSTTVESLASCSTYLSDSLPNDSGLVGMDSVPTFLDLSHASIHPCASSWIT
jgi:hypothetical protein